MDDRIWASIVPTKCLFHVTDHHFHVPPKIVINSWSSRLQFCLWNLSSQYVRWLNTLFPCKRDKYCLQVISSLQNARRRIIHFLYLSNYLKFCPLDQKSSFSQTLSQWIQFRSISIRHSRCIEHMQQQGVTKSLAVAVTVNSETLPPSMGRKLNWATGVNRGKILIHRQPERDPRRS